MTQAAVLAQMGSQNQTFRNRIINGAMVIDQRNAGASFTNSNAAVYGVDRWLTYGLSGAVLTCQQVTDAPSGFSNSFKVTISTATTANDVGIFPVQKIEAANCIDLQWGTSTAATVTVSFWVKASVTGTYNTSFIFAGPSTLYYVSTFTVNSANTWEYKTITVTGPTTGGAFSGALNATYLTLYTATIGSTGNTTYATPNTWSTSGASKTSGAVNIGSTLNATLQVTGVQLEAGTSATPFEYRSYGTELALCQRYFQKIADGSSNNTSYIATVTTDTTSSFFGLVAFQVAMRTAPTLAITATSFRANIGTVNANSTTAPTIVNTTNINTRIEQTGYGGALTADRSGIFRLNADSGYVAVQAEL